MKIKGAQKILIVAAIVFFLDAAAARAQQNGVQKANNFTSVEYFEPPHERQMKSRLSGAEALPQPGGLLVIRQLKLEMFSPDGKTEIVASAPECVYDTFNAVARSPGPLELQYGGGKIQVAGEGFLWRQNDSSLTISNNVRTVIENAPETKTNP